MPLDTQKYRHHVDKFDMPEDRKIALMESVWRIMESFVDRAYGVHPLQLCRQDSPSILQAPEKALESEILKLSSIFQDAHSNGET